MFSTHPFSVINLPNILTLFRIILLPFFVAAFLYNNYLYALIIFIVSGLSDILDGFIARTMKQTSDFGKVLDPVADKFFLITSFVLMGMYGVLPKWISVIVISRDIIVITGCLILYFVTNHLKIEPSAIGKLSNALQFILIGLALVALNLSSEMIVPPFFLILVAVVTSVSGLHYVYKGMTLAGAESAEP
jgi:cardiolipin synthase